MKLLSVLFMSSVFALASIVLAGDAKETSGAKAQTMKDVTPDEVATMIQGKAGAVLVLDVRTPEEFAEGHIAGAKNVDFMDDDFVKQVAALPADKPLVVHCAAGNRSAKAVAKISAMQKFAQILHMKAGFKGWKAAGKPIETKPAAR